MKYYLCLQLHIYVLNIYKVTGPLLALLHNASIHFKNINLYDHIKDKIKELNKKENYLNFLLKKLKEDN